MTPLGKPLAFYLKYMAEMDRIYNHEEGKNLDLPGLADAEQVRQMVGTVGDAACAQAADFLESCGDLIGNHFIGLGAALSGKKKRATIVNDWFWKVRVQVPSIGNGWFLCGVSFVGRPEVRVPIEKDAYGIVMPWLWAKGGHQGENILWDNLGGSAHSRGIDGLGQEKGLVALACIPIKPQPPDSFDVDRDPLVTEVVKTFEQIGAEQTKAIASSVAGLKESDEG